MIVLWKQMFWIDVSTPIQFTTLKKKSILFGLVKIILGYQNPKSSCLKGYQGFF